MVKAVANGLTAAGRQNGTLIKSDPITRGVDEYQDSDTREADRLENLRRTGTSHNSREGGAYDQSGGDPTQTALRARSKLRQGLNESISDAPGMLGDEVNLLKQDAGVALDKGLKNTRKNFNNRGLLYSGLREGGEQEVRSGVASTLASGTASARQDSENLTDSRKQAVASLGLATQAADLQRSEEVLEQTMKNRIARQQAQQSFYAGAGQLGGTVYSNSQKKTGT